MAKVMSHQLSLGLACEDRNWRQASPRVLLGAWCSVCLGGEQLSEEERREQALETVSFPRLPAPWLSGHLGTEGVDESLRPEEK